MLKRVVALILACSPAMAEEVAAESKLFRDFTVGAPIESVSGMKGLYRCDAKESWYCQPDVEFAGEQWLARVKFYGSRLGLVELERPNSDSTMGAAVKTLLEHEYLLLSMRAASGAYLDWIEVSSKNPLDKEGNQAKLLDWINRNGMNSAPGWKITYIDMAFPKRLLLRAMFLTSETAMLEHLGGHARLAVVESPTDQPKLLRITFVRPQGLLEILKSAAPPSTAPF